MVSGDKGKCPLATWKSLVTLPDCNRPLVDGNQKQRQREWVNFTNLALEEREGATARESVLWKGGGGFLRE